MYVGKLEKSNLNDWWVRFNCGVSIQLIDRLVDTSSFTEGKEIQFELKKASHVVLNSANLYRAYPI
jgi:hypothetical protein